MKGRERKETLVVTFSRSLPAVHMALDLAEGLGLRATVIEDGAGATHLYVRVPDDLRTSASASPRWTIPRSLRSPARSRM
jgi:hypothetical protein